VVDLQQSAADSAKVVVRIFAKPASGDGEALAHNFHFNSPNNARAEADALKDMLSRLIAEIRSTDTSIPRPAAPADGVNGTNGSGSAAMSFANAATARPAHSRWYDDGELIANTELQRSLMKKDPNLYQTFLSAVESKPAGVPDTEFMARFFSTRTSLLRAHAFEQHQQKGAYNVLSAVKPKTVEGELKVSLSQEQIQMILSQHPLVRRIYNENVPKPLAEGEFWSRFFLSRLSRKLRGERVESGLAADSLFDKFNEADDTVFSSRITTAPVPHVIDLEANEENQGGFRSGNRKDVEMRPRRDIPVVRTLNSLSEKIMANVGPSDHVYPNPDEPLADGSVMEDPYSELALRDLRGDVELNKIRLNVKEQSRFFNQNSEPSSDARAFETQVPSDVLFEVTADLETLEEDGAGGIDLHTGIGVDDDSDSDEDAPKAPHVGSRAEREAAQTHIFQGLERRQAEVSEEEKKSPMGIPADIAQRAYITNATTTEFLKQFWSAFLSGDPGRSQELAYHVEALKNCMKRIEAVAEEAEQARGKVVAQRKEEVRAHFARTGKKVKWRSDMVGGGSKAVMTLLGPSVNALEIARRRYQQACQEQGFQPPAEGTLSV
jgi:transcription initiation factor TFIIH subunit 1